eukprot:s341_g35.t1
MRAGAVGAEGNQVGSLRAVRAGKGALHHLGTSRIRAEGSGVPSSSRTELAEAGSVSAQKWAADYATPSGLRCLSDPARRLKDQANLLANDLPEQTSAGETIPSSREHARGPELKPVAGSNAIGLQNREQPTKVRPALFETSLK